MRIVIIGGRGLIGSAVTSAALARGAEVTVLTRGMTGLNETKSNYQMVHWDGKEAVELLPIIDGKDAVINLAGESIGKGKWTPERKDVLLSSRLEPARALLEALKRCKRIPKTLVQASAVGYYGTGTEYKDETSPAGDDFLAGFAKKWEESTARVENMGIRRILIRTGIVLQKGHGVLPQLMLPFTLMAGGPIGSGNQIYSWIHIEDEAAAILFLLENEKLKGIFNLTSPHPVSNRDMGKILGKVMHRPYWIPVPAFAMKLALGEMSTLVLDGQKVYPKRLESAGYRFKFPELEYALKNLLSAE